MDIPKVEIEDSKEKMVHMNRNPEVRFNTNTEMVYCVGLEVGTLGTCNFNSGRLTQLPDFCWTNNLPRPAVVQNELHPLQMAWDVRALYKREGIVSQAYASKGMGLWDSWTTGWLKLSPVR